MKFKMDRKSTTARSELMCILCDEEAEPKALSLALLEEITDGFSEEREIGRGGFAVVYKGILDNGAVVAVKRLSNTYMYEKQFQWEVECLIKAKHKNVVRFIGYCADSQGKAESYNGKFVMAEIQQRLLCFEYLSHGTLDKYITDESSGLDWRTRYKIINGICNGLHYLHQNRIVHLDLKPQNILLDGNMLPKIADFGQSRCFEENQSRVVTKNIGGTIGYLAPEFSSREITYQLDLYSLGVIILEILTGKKGYEAVENVLENWRNRLEKSHRDMQLKQVRVSTEIGIKCIDSNPANRPARTQDIIASLHETANAEGTIETVMTRSLAPQTSFVSELMDVSSTPSDQLRQISAPKVAGETSTEDFSFSGSSIFALDRTMTEQMSEMVLLAVVKIGYILEDETANAIVMNALSESVAKELSVKVKQIRKQLTMMGNVIKRTGMVYLRDQVVRSWIGEVRNVAYNVEDVMDKYSYHVLQHQQEGFLKKFFTKGTHHAVFSEITDHIVKVENEIQLVIQLKDQWLQPSQLIADPHIEMERHPSRRNLSECFDEHLVGIEENRSLLTGWLNSEEPESTVITVSGLGGLGKSTLVSNVYEREKINFDAHAWIVVSQMYTVHDLLRNLLWKIEYTEQPLSAGIEKMDVYDLRKEIKRRFQNIKCFIVLDDVWDRDIYFQMGDAFQNLQRSRIVITTRENDVATISSPTRHLELLPLSNHDAFNLFCKRAFYKRKGQICPKELEEIAASIVDKCHGLPLAIVSIGSMLSRRQRLEIWRQTYNELCNELSDNDHVRAILNLSYHDLSGELRSCLLYCTLFPEDHPMSCDSLVRLWVAEGFVLSNDKNTAEVVAERDIVELIHRNMLEVVEKDASGRISTCRMHDLVRELALSVAHQQRFASANDYGTMIQMDKDVRRLSLCGWNGDTVPKLKLPRLRTLVMLGLLSSSTGVLSSILSESNYLTVLELQDSEITEVPASIGNLFNLRYIGLRRTRIKSIPESIENLSNLHTIDIKQTKVEKLPRGLANVKKLRHLLADRYADEKKKQTGFHCYFIGMQAPRNMSNLEQLQTLETVASDNGLAQQLRKLMQLRSVWIDNITASDCADILDTLSNLPLLSSLLLSARDENEALCFQALKPKSRNLERLIIRGQWANGTLNCPIFLSHGTNLKYLALSWCRLVDDPLEKLAPHIPNLTYLRLNNMRSANALVLSADAFPNLKTLVLKHMHDVSELIIIEGALPCIQGLYIAALSKLDKVPRGIESLHSLKKLWLLSLHEDFKTEWITNGMHQKIQHIPEIRV